MNIQEAIQQFQSQRKVKGLWNQIRKSGRDNFLVHGLPCKDLEAWHYTSLKSFPEANLIPETNIKTNNKLTRSEALSLRQFLNTSFYNIVFVNGQLSKELSSKSLPKALSLSLVGSRKSLSVVKKIKTARAKIGGIRQDSMEALNSAFASDGIVISVATDSSIKKPLQIVHFHTNTKVVYPKLLMSLGFGSSLQLIETFVSVNESKSESMLDAAAEILIGQSAKLSYVRLQAQDAQASHVGSTRFTLEKDSHLESLTLAAGSKLSRHNLYVHCIGSNAFAQINGLTISDNEQHIDNNTLIDHVVGGCATTQLYKSILSGKSKTIFCGRVQIRKDAQKASSEQLNQNLLLSSTADANSKPELGIFADDVKASHGSTIGQISAEEIFYLMSRAISRSQALEMLSLGFVQGLVEKIPDKQVKNWLSEIVLQQYRKLGKDLGNR